MKFRFLRYYLLLTAILYCTLNSTAQTSKINTENNGLTGFRVGLFADNGVHPGLKLGTSYLLNEKEQNRKYLINASQNKRNNQLKIIQYLVDANVGFYNHPNNHLGVFVGAGITRMRTNTSNMKTLGWSFSVNYLRRIYNIPTLELSDNREVNEIEGAGNNSIMFALSPSFGKLFGVKKGKKEWQIYLKPSLQLLKYDFSFFPNASLEIGTSFNLF